MEKKSTHVVVLGAGFGGMTFCQNFTAPNTRVTLIDRQNHHLFQPLLYQVASAGLSAPNIAQPIRAILTDKQNLTVLMDNVIEVRLADREVILEKNKFSYDYLVLALGSVTAYFGHPEWEQFAPGLKTLDDAIRIRRHILLAFERAETERDPTLHQQLLTIVVVGGGPTGVELAGTFAELSNHVLAKDFDHIDPTEARIVLIEGGSQVLGTFGPKLAQSAKEQLESLGVEVRTNARVKNISNRCVELEGGEKIFAENIIWGAGVMASPVTRKMEVEVDKAGRVKVCPDLSIPGHPNVFVLGDMAAVTNADGTPVPGVAPAAMQMAKYVACIIHSELMSPGRSDRDPFKYRDKGWMATIGRSAAVAKIKDFEFSGFFAWLAWLFVHLVFLVGFRNKMAVFFSWVYSYATYKRGARIITGLREESPVNELSDTI